jgi:hypothetical protein
VFKTFGKQVWHKELSAIIKKAPECLSANEIILIVLDELRKRPQYEEYMKSLKRISNA